MTDENIQQPAVTEEIKTLTETVVESKAETSIEDTARSMGWKPLEEFEGNKENWADAKEYVRVGKIIEDRDKKAAKLEREIKELKNITKTMLTTMQKQEAIAYEKASRDLELKLARAKEIGDVEEALDISQQQKDLHQAVQQQQLQQQTNLKDSEEFQTFYPRNKWVLGTDRKSKAMQSVASDISTDYAKAHPNASLKDELDHIDVEMRKEFPEYFKSEDTKTSTTVLSGSSNKPDAGTKETKFTSGEKQIIEYLKLKGYDYKAYAKMLGK